MVEKVWRTDGRIDGQMDRRIEIFLRATWSQLKISKLRITGLLWRESTGDRWLPSQLQFEFTHGSEAMHKAWCSIEEVPYCFSMSSIEFQGHAGKKKHRYWPELISSGQ